MKLFSKLFILMLALAGFWAANVQAEEMAAPAVDPKAAEAQAAMEKMKTAMAPGEAHKVLEPLVGKWTYTAKFWMSPEAKPDESTGTSEGAMIYGGRFLQEKVSGTMMGEPFEGISYTGYDNVRAEYTGIWLDSMATGIMTSSGQYDAATKTLKCNSVMSCPMTGEKDRKSRMETIITDNDHHTLVSYMNDPAGKEFKNMEIVYTRVS